MEQVCKNFKINLISIFLILMFHKLWLMTFFTNSTRYTNLGLFWPNFRMTSEHGIWNGPWYHNFKKLVPKMNYWKTIVIEFDFFLSQLEYSIQVWPLFGTIFTLWHHEIVKFPNFGKMIKDKIFYLKKYTWFQV